MDRIPSVDLKDFLSEDSNRKQKFIEKTTRLLDAVMIDTD